jgi:DNA-binding response OmpR family regulator
MSKEGEFLIGIIDDHIQTGVNISQILEFNGFKTFQAYSLEDAIKLIGEKDPDLIILDVCMQYNHEGYEIAKKFPKKKVLFMSASNPEEKMLKMKNIGGYIEKPINSEELLKKVRKILKV